MSIERWQSRVAENSGEKYVRVFRRFLEWLGKGDGGLSLLDADGLIAFQKEYRDFQILDLVQGYVNSFEGTENYKRFVYAVLKSFFMHNRASLPQDRSFKVRGERPKNVATLNVGEFKRVLDSSNECYRAVLLCMFQGGMGGGEVEHWSDHGWPSLSRQIELGGNPIRIDLPGRKQGRNTRPFYTFVGRDAIDAIRIWLRRRPENVEAIFTNQFGGPITRYSIRYYWTRKLHRLGLIKKPEPWIKGYRYGKNVHELRDIFRSRWQKSGRAPEAAEFFMGHVIDPNDYNKAFQDEHYSRMEYRRAERWLNVVSQDPEHVHVDEVDGMTEKVDSLEKIVEKQGEWILELMKRINQ